MARISGVDIPREKRLEISLTYIYGIGRTLSQQICAATGIDPNTRVRDLTDEEVSRIRTYIDQSVKVEGDLRREVSQDIKRKMEIGCYQGLRHRKGLPVHGQRTHTNARTRKGPRRPWPARRRCADHGQARRRGPSSPPQGTQERHLRGGAHQELVQQHDRVDHRPGRQRAGLGLGRQRGVQGLAQVHARSPPRWPPSSAPAEPWSTASARST